MNKESGNFRGTQEFNACTDSAFERFSRFGLAIAPAFSQRVFEAVILFALRIMSVTIAADDLNFRVLGQPAGRPLAVRSGRGWRFDCTPSVANHCDT
jgi:hypothetical protein